MSIQLNSVDHAPVSLPYWQTMMDDLCNPPARRVARVLGIGERTVYRYSQTGAAPRVVCLAMFWLTSWGRSAVNAQAVNDARMAVGYVDSLRIEVARLEAESRRLVALGGLGAANDAVLLAGLPRQDRIGRPL